MIDINKTIDLIKLRFYNEWLYTHLYDEGDSQMHKTLTERVIAQYIEPLNLSIDDKILDIGCGPGYFLDEMRNRGFCNLQGITLSKQDASICAEKGHIVEIYDMTFLPQKDGFTDESYNFIFLRHSLEHSPYPIFSLIEYNRLLKRGGKIYIETPTPDCERKHEYNINHYSILGKNQLAALLLRTGFKIDIFETMNYDVAGKNPKTGEDFTANEESYCIVATKTKTLDIK